MRWILATMLAALAPDLAHYLLALAAVAGLVFLMTTPPQERPPARLSPAA